jgi:hypothetical protein
MRHVASDLANQSPMAIPSAVQEARDQPLRNSHYGSLTDAERGLRAKNAPAGPLTLLSRKSTAAAAATANEQLPLPSAAVVARETGDEVFPDTMSLAAVESIQRLPTVDDDHAGPLRSRTARHSRASKAPFINSRIDRVLAPLKRVAQPVRARGRWRGRFARSDWIQCGGVARARSRAVRCQRGVRALAPSPTRRSPALACAC